MENLSAQICLAQLHSSQKAINHSFWSAYGSQLIASDFKTCAPYTDYSCLEAVFPQKFGCNRKIDIQNDIPLDQQAILLNGHHRTFIENGRSVGNFFGISILYISVLLGKADYVLWKVGEDLSLIHKGAKRDFLMKCLGLENDCQDRQKRVEEIMITGFISRYNMTNTTRQIDM